MGVLAGAKERMNLMSMKKENIKKKNNTQNCGFSYNNGISNGILKKLIV